VHRSPAVRCWQQKKGRIYFSLDVPDSRFDPVKKNAVGQLAVDPTACLIIFRPTLIGFPPETSVACIGAPLNLYRHSLSTSLPPDALSEVRFESTLVS
jgi:hypothetical protein